MKQLWNKFSTRTTKAIWWTNLVLNFHFKDRKEIKMLVIFIKVKSCGTSGLENWILSELSLFSLSLGKSDATAMNTMEVQWQSRRSPDVFYLMNEIKRQLRIRDWASCNFNTFKVFCSEGMKNWRDCLEVRYPVSLTTWRIDFKLQTITSKCQIF